MRMSYNGGGSAAWTRKEGPKVIKAIKPFAKIAGAKSVLDVKNLASAARIKAASFGYKEGIKKAMKKMKDIK